MLCVSRSVRPPMRAAARAASVPAWPPPTMITSNSLGNCMGSVDSTRWFHVKPQRRVNLLVPRGTSLWVDHDAALQQRMISLARYAVLLQRDDMRQLLGASLLGRLP